MRKYNFSKLAKPLHECCRAYCYKDGDGFYKVAIVQSESEVWLDTETYVIDHRHEALAAAEEIGNMIAAAKALVKGST